MVAINVQDYRRLPDIGPRGVGALPSHVLAKIDHGDSTLKAVREWRGISQVDLADRSGVAITQITRAEDGQDCSIAVLRHLARALRVCDDVLVGSSTEAAGANTLDPTPRRR